MRLIVVGCEYTGKTTLVNGLMDWGHKHGLHHHMDDHFTIPDCQTLTETSDREAMIALPNAIKERFQRFQVAYHVKLTHRYEHILLTGFYIEEVVYGGRYYYPGSRVIENPRRAETELPSDCILVHLTATPGAIVSRMEQNPHPYPVVPKEDVPEILDAFATEYRASWFRNKFEIDTSELSDTELVDTFLRLSVPHLTEKDLAFRVAVDNGIC